MKSGKVNATAVRGGAVKAKATAAEDISARKFLSVRQVAKRWGASQSTVRRLIEEGKLKGIKLRHACRLSIVSVVEYEEEAHF